MKKIYSLAIILLFATIVSCTDDSLDPLNFKSVNKGTLLALRGAFLQAIYIDGTPGAKFIPLIADGSEKFTFDAEYLSEDPTTLASMDIYIEKKPSLERVFLKNVPFSEFKNDGKYSRPWVNVSIPLSDVLTKIGITPTYPLPSDVVANLVDVYKFGINVITDLNLTDGTKVLADDLVAAGLYQSNQFYPAQNLAFTVINYCAYDEDSWANSYDATEIYSNGAGDPYKVTLSKTGTPHQFLLTNYWGVGNQSTAIIEFKVSTNPDDQVVIFPDQTSIDTDGDYNGKLSGTGTYDQCTGTFKIQVKYGPIPADGAASTNVYTFRYEFSPQ